MLNENKNNNNNLQVNTPLHADAVNPLPAPAVAQDQQLIDEDHEDAAEEVATLQQLALAQAGITDATQIEALQSVATNNSLDKIRKQQACWRTMDAEMGPTKRFDNYDDFYKAIKDGETTKRAFTQFTKSLSTVNKNPASRFYQPADGNDYNVPEEVAGRVLAYLLLTRPGNVPPVIKAPVVQEETGGHGTVGEEQREEMIPATHYNRDPNTNQAYTTMKQVVAYLQLPGNDELLASVMTKYSASPFKGDPAATSLPFFLAISPCVLEVLDALSKSIATDFMGHAPKLTRAEVTDFYAFVEAAHDRMVAIDQEKDKATDAAKKAMEAAEKAKAAAEQALASHQRQQQAAASKQQPPPPVQTLSSPEGPVVSCGVSAAAGVPSVMQVGDALSHGIANAIITVLATKSNCAASKSVEPQVEILQGLTEEQRERYQKNADLEKACLEQIQLDDLQRATEDSGKTGFDVKEIGVLGTGAALKGKLFVLCTKERPSVKSAICLKLIRVTTNKFGVADAAILSGGSGSLAHTQQKQQVDSINRCLLMAVKILGDNTLGFLLVGGAESLMKSLLRVLKSVRRVEDLNLAINSLGEYIPMVTSIVAQVLNAYLVAMDDVLIDNGSKKRRKFWEKLEASDAVFLREDLDWFRESLGKHSTLFDEFLGSVVAFSRLLDELDTFVSISEDNMCIDYARLCLIVTHFLSNNSSAPWADNVKRRELQALFDSATQDDFVRRDELSVASYIAVFLNRAVADSISAGALDHQVAGMFQKLYQANKKVTFNLRSNTLTSSQPPSALKKPLPARSQPAVSDADDDDDALSLSGRRSNSRSRNQSTRRRRSSASSSRASSNQSLPAANSASGRQGQTKPANTANRNAGGSVRRELDVAWVQAQSELKEALQGRTCIWEKADCPFHLGKGHKIDRCNLWTTLDEEGKKKLKSKYPKCFPK